jgi:hypothetical protein
MRFFILLAFVLIVSESFAQSTTTKLFLNKDYQITTTTSDVFYSVNQTMINSSPKIWIDSIFNHNLVDSITLVRVNKYEVSGNDTLLNGVNSKSAIINILEKNETLEKSEKVIPLNDTLLVKPKFKDGFNFTEFLNDNLIYPKVAVDNNQECKVIVTFVIEIDGKVSLVEARNCSFEWLNKEANRIIMLTSGKWIPGELNGNKVRVSAMIPITFSLD